MSEGDRYCIYMVTYSPEGCGLQPGQILFLPCDPPCEDMELSDGDCAGCQLQALASECSDAP